MGSSCSTDGTIDAFSAASQLPADSIQAKRSLSVGSHDDHEHLPLLGHSDLLVNARKIVFDATPEAEGNIASIQTIAGTGANHLGALLLA